MQSVLKTYEVAVAAPVPQTLTYAQPESGLPDRQTIAPGSRVLVPLGRRRVTGFILGPGVAPKEDSKGFAVKPILELLDDQPVFPEGLIPFYRWIAEYYHYPLGEVIRTALPGGLTTGSRKCIRLTEQGKTFLPGESANLDGSQYEWVAALLAKGELSPAATAKLPRKGPVRRLVADWQKKGWIEVVDSLQRGAFLEKKQAFVFFSEAVADLLNPEYTEFETALLEKFPDLKQSERKTLLLFYEQWLASGKGPVSRPDITREYGGAGKALKDLAARDILRIEELRVYRDPLGERTQFFSRPEQLSREQENVLAELLPLAAEPEFQPFLLHGVTGCGKTEIYLRTAEAVLRAGRTVLVLVPEIALSSQLEAHFYSRFGDVVAVLHSGLSPGERHDQWHRIMDGSARIVIGARSAVFAPLTNPGLLIVDEEHEPSYKQEDGFRYHGRDLAVLRAKYAGCPVILGSATPSVTSYHHALSGKYRLLQMRSRIEGQRLPEVSVVDLGTVKSSRPDLLFSDQLLSALWENVEKRQQSLLFVNRRGFASFMMCTDCGHIVQCRHCQVSLTLHQRRQRLVCHYCGYELTTRIVCPACNSRRIKGMGLGAERVEEEVRQSIPHARIARLDSDTATSRRRYLDILRAVRQHEVDILIGTQMIAKGLHFPNITLVGVVWADSSLSMPDFRASERSFQLLAQVTGRAGRGEHPGRVIIQTFQPHHYAVQCARGHDYTSFYQQEEALRQDLQYPPFSRMVNIRLSSPDETRVRECAEKISTYLRRAGKQPSYREIEVLGPAPAPLARIKDRVRWQVLLKGTRLNALHSLCSRLQEEFKNLCAANVTFHLDVDPESMM